MAPWPPLWIRHCSQSGMTRESGEQQQPEKSKLPDKADKISTERSNCQTVGKLRIPLEEPWPAYGDSLDMEPGRTRTEVSKENQDMEACQPLLMGSVDSTGRGRNAERPECRTLRSWSLWVGLEWWTPWMPTCRVCVSTLCPMTSMFHVLTCALAMR